MVNKIKGKQLLPYYFREERANLIMHRKFQFIFGLNSAYVSLLGASTIIAPNNKTQDWPQQLQWTLQTKQKWVVQTMH